MIIFLMIVFIVLVIIEMAITVLRSNKQLKKMESLIESVSQSVRNTGTSTHSSSIAGSIKQVFEAVERQLNESQQIQNLIAGKLSEQHQSSQKFQQTVSGVLTSFESNQKAMSDTLDKLCSIQLSMQKSEPLSIDISEIRTLSNRFLVDIKEQLTQQSDKLFSTMQNVIQSIQSMPKEKQLTLIADKLSGQRQTDQKFQQTVSGLLTTYEANQKAMYDTLNKLCSIQLSMQKSEPLSVDISEIRTLSNHFLVDIKEQLTQQSDKLFSTMQNVIQSIQSLPKEMQQSYEPVPSGKTAPAPAADIKLDVSPIKDELHAWQETFQASLNTFMDDAKNNQKSLSGGIGGFVENLEKMLGGYAANVNALSNKMEKSEQLLEETANLSRVNQVALQADIEMLDKALSSLLEKISQQIEKPDEENAFVQRLNNTLESFHEKATEVLIDNTVKMRELLLNTDEREPNQKASEA